MQFTAQQIAAALNGTVEGNADVAVNTLAKIEEGQAGSLSFLSNPKYEPYLYTTDASVVIVNNELVLSGAVKATLIRVENAYSAFTTLLEMYNTVKLNKIGIEQPSFIHETAQIGQDVYIGAFAYIGPGAKIGDNSKIYPGAYVGDNVTLGTNVTLFAGVKVYFDCVLGNNAIIHSGAIIGSDGFGFAPTGDGSYKKIPQIGNVILEDDVEVGSNTTIDRATMGSTVIRKGVKLDNLIMIAHNVEIGANTVIAAQTGISGSTKVGQNAVFGGQVGLAGHITIADGTQLGAQTGVNSSIKEPGKPWGGTPHLPHRDFLKASVNIRRLPDLEQRVRELENIISDLKRNS